MAEEGLGDPEGLSTPAEVPPVVPAAFVDAEGNFTEGWRDLLDEDLRGEKSLESVKDIKNLARSYVNTKRMVGADTVAVPNENSSETVWEELYDRLGRPTTVDDYELPVPDEYKEYYNDDMVRAGRDMFHKIGLNQKQAQALWAFEQMRLEKGVTSQISDAEQEMKTAEDALRQKWGEAYDERKHMANRMIADNVEDEESKKKLVAKIGNDPVVADFLANIANKFIEHKVITDMTSIQSTPDQVQTEIDEVVNSADYRGGPEIPAAIHKAAVAKAARLFEQKNANAQRLADAAAAAAAAR